MASGCICCGEGLGEGTLEGYRGDDTPDSDDEQYCTPPYIQVGDDCCVDINDNGICDEDEGDDEPVRTSPTTTAQVATTQAPAAISTTLAPTTTAASAPTTFSAPTTTTPGAYAPTYQCVKDAWSQQAADGVLYFYSSPRCGSQFIPKASTAQGRTGVFFTKIQIEGDLDDRTWAIMECFYGEYSESNKEFGKCPRLLCPKTGEIKDLRDISSSSVLSQMTGFAKSC